VNRTRRLGDAQHRLQLGSIEADDGLAVDQRDGRGAEAQLQQLLQGRLVLADVLADERDLVSRKELFLLVARASAGLRVQHHLLRHAGPPSCLPFGTESDARPQFSWDYT
jgi:hypothetical protein